MMRVARPVLRWHGGKWRLAPWVISHFPAHRTYVEPFGGAASVLLRKPPAYSEVYNDLDGEVVNLFRVLRNRRQADELRRALEATPFAREEFELAARQARFPVERARRLVVRSYMGFGSDSAHSGQCTGFRAQSAQSNRSPERDWRNYPAKLEAVVDRMRDVVIERRDALAVSARHDSAETLHYLDPPYLPVTRSAKARKGGTRYHAYRHEMDDSDHRAMIDGVRALAGMVVLSGYPSDMYDRALADWRRVECAAFADGARPRTEVLWINPACAEALDREQEQPKLFEGVA